MGKAEDHPSKTSVPQPSISASASAPPFIPPCISPALCMGGEALAGCQSACGGVNGQPSAQNTLWMSDTPRCTNERLQARLVRLNRELFPSHCVNVTCIFLYSFKAVMYAKHIPARDQTSVTIFWTMAVLTYVIPRPICRAEWTVKYLCFFYKKKQQQKQITFCPSAPVHVYMFR